MNDFKTVSVLGLSCLLATAATAQTATSATSSPVGYETISIDQDFEYIGLRLVETPEITTTVSSISGSEITLEAASPSDGDLIIEIDSGAAEGAIELADVAGDMVTVSSGLAGDLSLGDSLTLRKPNTLASIFGDPATAIDGAAGAGAADLVLVPDGSGGFDTYFYSTGNFVGAGAGWKQVSSDGSTSDVVASSVNLIYTDGLVIQNRGDDNSLVVSGSVKRTSTDVVMTSDFNYLATLYPAGSTLSSAFDDPLNPGVLRAGTLDSAAGAGASDLVLVPQTDGSFNTYFYSSGNFTGAGAGWKQIASDGTTSDVISTSISLDDVSSIIIQNRGTLPQSVSIMPPTFYDNL